MLEHFTKLMERYDPSTGEMKGGKEVIRRLSQLEGVFCDEQAYHRAIAKEDSIVYRISVVEPADGPGDLHYGLGVLYPGKVGDEYYLTKGHLHSTREAAEVYIGLEGEGVMLLQDESTKECRLESLGVGKVVYVPGCTAHRTLNIGKVPLTYFGVYPANAGHDYAAISESNFLKVLIEEGGEPVLKDRKSLLP